MSTYDNINNPYHLRELAALVMRWYGACELVEIHDKDSQGVVRWDKVDWTKGRGREIAEARQTFVRRLTEIARDQPHDTGELAYLRGRVEQLTRDLADRRYCKCCGRDA